MSLSPKGLQQTPIPLSCLPVGASAVVRSLASTGTLRRRMLDLGFLPGAIVETLQKSPAGDPIAYLIRGTVIALRSGDAENILVEEDYAD